MAKLVKESERFELIKRINKQAPPGTEDGVGVFDVNWLISTVEGLQTEVKRLDIALHTHQSYDKTASELYEENKQLRTTLEQVRERIGGHIESTGLCIMIDESLHTQPTDTGE